MMKDAERQILEHYGQKKQELQAVQELSELILLLAAREDQRGDDYKKRMTEEIADTLVMIEQVKMMNDITDEAVAVMMKYKLCRQLDRIDKEKGNEP